MFHSFVDGGIRNSGLVGDAISGVENGLGNGLVCSVFGPNFLKIILDSNDCPKEMLQPNAFQSRESFCPFYKHASAYLKKCLTVAAAKIKINIPGIITFGENIGTCCSSCKDGKQCEMKFEIIRFYICN